MKRNPNGPKITKFRDILDWIFYDWDYNYKLSKDSDGSFYVNKLYIEPEYLSYKTECYEIEAGLFERVEKLYEVIKEEDE